jgi:mRNA-degrading endonuclease RelE of RelBE toxin-antitoxin system
VIKLNLVGKQKRTGKPYHKRSSILYSYSLLIILSSTLIFSCLTGSKANAARNTSSEQLPALPDVVSGGSSESSTSQTGKQVKNIFSHPASDDNEAPSYTKPGGSQDLNSPQDNLPIFEQIRLIPSLSGQQRKQISNIYDQLKKDLDPIQTEIKTVNQRISDIRTKKSNGLPINTASGAKGKPPGSSTDNLTTGVSQLDANDSKPWLRPLDTIDSPVFMTQDDKPMDIDSLKKQAKDLSDQIQAKRQATWEQISQQILTPEQVDNLSKMRRGEIIRGDNGQK